MNRYRDFILGRARKILSGHTQVHSPCVSVCSIDPDTGHCLGCWRTRDEVATWSSLDTDAQRRVWVAIEQRALAWVPPPAAADPAGGAST